MKTLLYASELADDAPASVVGVITKTARLNNSQRGIHGLLIFDGVRFAQMLEGPAPAIDALLGTLRTDRRHGNLQVLSLREHDGATRFVDWTLGYLLIDDDESQGIARLRQLQEMVAAEAAFMELAATVDRDGVPSVAALL